MRHNYVMGNLGRRVARLQIPWWRPTLALLLFPLEVFARRLYITRSDSPRPLLATSFTDVGILVNMSDAAPAILIILITLLRK